MKFKLTHIKTGIIKWYDKYVAIMGWKTMLMAPLIPNMIDNFVNKNAELLSYVTDANGDIDLDLLVQKYQDIITRNGGKIELFGILFDNNDLNNLASEIKSTRPM